MPTCRHNWISLIVRTHQWCRKCGAIRDGFRPPVGSIAEIVWRPPVLPESALKEQTHDSVTVQGEVKPCE